MSKISDTEVVVKEDKIKVKMVQNIEDKYHAGCIYEIEEGKAREWISNSVAIRVK